MFALKDPTVTGQDFVHIETKIRVTVECIELPHVLAPHAPFNLHTTIPVSKDK